MSFYNESYLCNVVPYNLLGTVGVLFGVLEHFLKNREIIIF